MYVYYTAIIVCGNFLYLKRTASRRKHLSEEEDAKVWDDAHERLSLRVLHLIHSLRGFWIKAGQYMSSRSDVVPQIWVQQLNSLQDALPPVATKDVERALEASLGMRISDVFESWDPNALATASIAQVHRATMKGAFTVALALALAVTFAVTVAVQVQSVALPILIRTHARKTVLLPLTFIFLAQM